MSIILSPYIYDVPDPEVDRFHTWVRVCYRKGTLRTGYAYFAILQHVKSGVYFGMPPNIGHNIELGYNFDDAKIKYDAILSETYTLLTKERFEKLQLLI